MRRFSRLECLQQQAVTLFFWNLGLWMTGYTVVPPSWADWMPSPVGFWLLQSVPIAAFTIFTLLRLAMDDLPKS